KLKEPELIEPLIPICRSCLEHRHSYVRKNAVFTIYSIYKEFESLIPDAPELIQTFLAAESDMTCKRNAFVFLANCSMPRAVEYLLSVYEQIPSLDELMQLAFIELIRKDCLGETPNRNPAAIKAAAACFVDLVVKESDNNVKLIVLDRLEALRAKHEHVLDPLVMDLLRVLGAPDMEVRRKCLTIALAMVTSRNVEDVVGTLKKQLIKTLEADYDKSLEYRQLLIQSIHICAIKFSEVAASVVHALMEFLGDSNNPSAVDVIAFVREVVEKFPNLRASITEKLLQTFGDIKSGKVFRGALWITGEYCAEAADIQAAMQALRKVIGEIPILAAEQRLADDAGAGEEGSEEKKTSSSHPRVLADGTYATESAYTSKIDVKNASKPPLRALILGGDFYTGSVVASTLVKLVLRLSQVSNDTKAVNALRAEAMLIMTSIIRVGQSKFAAVPIDEDSQERVMNCITTLANLDTSGKPKAQEDETVDEIFLKDTKAAYAKMVATEERKAAEKKEKENKTSAVQFRSMWTEFEWENRVNVNTTITDLRAYLKHIMKSTNMACLTPEAALSGDCDFLSANMYARSLFGEDALANLSIEKMEDTGTIQGHVRIRSKTQGIALSLGDKITLAQKELAAAA
ncbi:coatomer subunit beta, partial [Tulasnella sp. 417]